MKTRSSWLIQAWSVVVHSFDTFTGGFGLPGGGDNYFIAPVLSRPHIGPIWNNWPKKWLVRAELVEGLRLLGPRLVSRRPEKPDQQLRDCQQRPDLWRQDVDQQTAGAQIEHSRHRRIGPVSVGDSAPLPIRVCGAGWAASPPSSPALRTGRSSGSLDRGQARRGL